MKKLCSEPVDVITACRLTDLRILALAAERLRRFVPLKKLHVVTARENLPIFTKTLGPDVVIIDEDSMIPDMTLEQLRQLQERGFPKGAGWYFQQLLKFAFAFQKTEDDHYLIWDADTIPLRPMEFFDEQNRMLFTTASEYNPDYFATYKKLLHHDPHREFSFISQHIIVRKSILREMLAAIEINFSGNENWAWKIMRNLEGETSNRFSEYEMFGHYVKNIHPSTAVYRDLPWSRDGVRLTSSHPSESDLEKLAENFAFVAFESSHGFLRRTKRKLQSWLPRPFSKG